MTDQERESAYLLQKIDCNCSDCTFMVRNQDRFNQSLAWHEAMSLTDFERQKEKAISDAEALPFGKEREGMLRVAHKMKFQFDKKSVMIHYGYCTKFKKDVSFIPNVCQIETQKCFTHRKDINTREIVSTVST